MRRLSPDESALWARVMATVSPLRAVAVPAPVPALTPVAAPTESHTPAKRLKGRVPAVVVPPPLKVAPRPITSTTLDGSWDKRLVRGSVQPDRTIDLHGHTLNSAHTLLDQALGDAIARGDRVLLLVTGKPPRPESERPHARGAIRAAVADWLAGSRHADAIAGVRGAHPRHGGTGALYIVLRRRR